MGEMRSVLVAALLFFLSFAAAAEQQTAVTAWDGVYTTEQSRRGKAEYAQNCGGCHGEFLEGREPAPALADQRFLAAWAGRTLQDLFQRLRATMPQDRPGGLSPQAYADILAFMLESNQFPAGSQELRPEERLLANVGLRKAKP